MVIVQVPRNDSLAAAVTEGAWEMFRAIESPDLVSPTLDEGALIEAARDAADSVGLHFIEHATAGRLFSLGHVLIATLMPLVVTRSLAVQVEVYASCVTWPDRAVAQRKHSTTIGWPERRVEVAHAA